MNTLLDMIQKALGTASLTAPQLADLMTKAALQLPPGATQDEINAFVTQQIAAAFSPQNLALAQATVTQAVIQFFVHGSGPVQKSPADVVG